MKQIFNIDGQKWQIELTNASRNGEFTPCFHLYKREYSSLMKRSIWQHTDRNTVYSFNGAKMYPDEITNLILIKYL